MCVSRTNSLLGPRDLRVGPRTPNLNCYAKCWVLSIKSECLDHFVYRLHFSLDAPPPIADHIFFLPQRPPAFKPRQLLLF
jgi:hypothetical protein